MGSLWFRIRGYIRDYGKLQEEPQGLQKVRVQGKGSGFGVEGFA